MTLHDFELLVKILIAAVFGALIGYERQRFQKPAGIRTQMLICAGSALLAGLSIDIALQYTTPGALVRPDPTRLMAQIIAGIGFIGGGVILKGDNKISGVTTAATIWLTAAVGIAVGTRFYLVATGCVVLALLTHPLSRIKHTRTPTRIPYIIRTSKKQWPRLMNFIDRSNVEYQITRVGASKCELRVYSTRETKNELIRSLAKAKIVFEMNGG
jgi:putative Mg2+ transporter-C (MgtC) family protein